MKAFLSALTGAVLISVCPWTLAASTVDLTVSGTITPTACTPALSQGGVIDHGKIAVKDLNPTTSTLLPHTFVQMQVSCDSAALFALRGIDNRPGSADGVYGYGLGFINETQRLGLFLLTLLDPLAERAPVTKLASYNNGATWIENSNEAIWMSDRLAAFGTNTGGTWAPMPIKELTSQLRVSVYIAATNGLTLTEEQPLDGSATLELLYL